MKHKRNLYGCFVVFMICSAAVNGQDIVSFPVTSDQYFVRLTFVNPAAMSVDHLPEFYLNSRVYTGLFSGVSQNFVGGNVYKKKEGQYLYHGFGMHLKGTREGPFIQRNRAYLKYAAQIDLTSMSSLSLGLGVGLINHVYRSTSAAPGGSDLTGDLNVGIEFQAKSLSIGAALHQPLNPSLVPLSNIITFSRYYSFNVGWNKGFSPNYHLDLMGLIQYQQVDFWNLRMTALMNIEKHFIVGSGLNKSFGFLGYVGLDDILLAQQQLQFLVSYLLWNTRKIAAGSDSVVELSLRLVLNKSTKLE